MSSVYPTNLDNFANVAAGDTITEGKTNDLNDAVEALEAKVGKDGSAVTTSHDYLLSHLPAQAQNFDIGAYNLRGLTLTSDVATGTIPVNVTSTTACTNLNADMIDGKHVAGTNGAGEITTNDGTQTLTNKTLTSPAINGGTISTTTVVNANKITGLANIEAAAGYIPVANLSGITATQLASNAVTTIKITDANVTEAKLLLADNTTGNASTSAHGFIKKLSNVATEFMNGVGNWAVPPATSLGSWVDKSSSYAAQQAATDGFVVVMVTVTAGEGNSVYIYTDANSSANTARTGVKNAFGDRTMFFGLCCPVKKNDYWKVAGSITSIAVYWIPLGS